MDMSPSKRRAGSCTPPASPKQRSCEVARLPLIHLHPLDTSPHIPEIAKQTPKQLPSPEDDETQASLPPTTETKAIHPKSGARSTAFTEFKQALQLWDFKIGYDEQDPTAIDRVEGILCDEGTPRASDSSQEESRRRCRVFGLLEYRLRQTLWYFGYRLAVFTMKYERGLQVLEITVRCTEELPERLPAWLRIPYIRPVEPKTLSYTQEVVEATHDRIRAGDRVIDKYGRVDAYGTLGAMLVERKEFEDKDEFYGITAGHVLTGGTNFQIVQSLTDERIEATPVPLRNSNPDDGLSAEIGILRLRSEDKDRFCAIISRLNINHYHDGPLTTIRNSDINFQIGDTGVTRAFSIHNAMGRAPIYVFKAGAASGLTMGLLTEIRWALPPRWTKTKSADNEFVTKEDSSLDNEASEADAEFDDILREEYSTLTKPRMYRWLGIVKWTECKFSAPGDSGSLVYASEGVVKIPLGIHLGAPDDLPGTSMFLSLECFFIETRLMDLQLEFSQEE